MRSITLLAIELENFRSFREHTRIELSPMMGLKFLSGDNQAEPRLGANGAGKSTIWDAVAYCLYGSSVKGMRASDLVTWGEKQPVVTTHWSIAGEAIVIERRGSPNVLILNEVPVEQISVDQVIGLSRARFLQSVIFGQAVPLFIDLVGPERGALLDEVLDLGLWLKASERASQAEAALSKEIDAANREISFCNGKIEGLPKLEDLTAEIDAWEGEQAKQIEAAIQVVEDAELEMDEIAALVDKTKATADALPSMQSLNDRVSMYQKAKGIKEAEYRAMFAEQQVLQKRIQFYNHSRVCDTCMQTIDPAFVRGQLTKLSADKRALEIRIQLNGPEQLQITVMLDALAAEQDKLRRKREFLIEQRSNASARHAEQERLIQSATRACELMIEAANPHVTRYERVVADLAATNKRLRSAMGARRIATSKSMRMEFWKAAFKRVRLFMVKRTLAQLEVETASAAAALGLIGWKVGFTTELETKSGTMRQGIHIQVSSPLSTAPWEAWSGGEGQRVRLAVALGLASMIQRMAGVVVNFEVWDEPTAHLGSEGIEDLFECLRNRVISTRKSVWVCDHRALSHSGFSEIWQVCKTATGSQVSLLSNQED